MAWSQLSFVDILREFEAVARPPLGVRWEMRGNVINLAKRISRRRRALESGKKLKDRTLHKKWRAEIARKIAARAA